MPAEKSLKGSSEAWSRSEEMRLFSAALQLPRNGSAMHLHLKPAALHCNIIMG